jgi:hypothetical protein
MIPRDGGIIFRDIVDKLGCASLATNAVVRPIPC